MLIRRYLVTGIFERTKRKRTIEIPAKSLDEAKQIAFEQGYSCLLEVTEKPTDLPTIAQIEYAASLGAFIPKNASKQDLSAIIQKKLDNDSEPSKDLIDFGNFHQIIFSEYIGKKALYDIVFANLNQVDKIAFFSLCVYRWLTDDRQGNLETHPKKQFFYNFAYQVIDNEKVVSSVNRYEGGQLRFFSRIIKSNGEELVGGSVNTIAYKAVCHYLQTTLKIATNKKTHRFKDKKKETDKVSYQNDKGCLGIVAFFILFLFLWFVY